MTDGVVYGNGTATSEQIAVHLYECDARFVPLLTGRVEISAYAAKITNFGQRFEAWSNGRLVGLLAAYMNDAGRHDAYITTVSVTREYSGLGIATRLLQNCLQEARTKNFQRISLEVFSGNAVAIRLYERCGFSGMGTPLASARRMSIDLTDPRWKQ